MKQLLQQRLHKTLTATEWHFDFAIERQGLYALEITARAQFSEARNQPHEAKIWVAGSVLNRVQARAWPDTIHDVILQQGQYDPIKPTDGNYPKIIDPLQGADALTTKAWRECYVIARDMISRVLDNPTEATHFHGLGVTRERFMRIIGREGKFLRKIGDTSFYFAPH